MLNQGKKLGRLRVVTEVAVEKALFLYDGGLGYRATALVVALQTS